MIKTLLKEPLLHFLMLGAALFYFYTLMANNQTSSSEITISENKIAQLTYSFEKSRQRKPSKKELDALISNTFKERVAYRKGVEMGLLDGDSIIQKRIQQKLEFIVEDAVSSMTPTEKQLNQYLTEHSDDYRSPRFFSFIQIYLDPQKHDNLNTSLQAVNKTLASKLKGELTSEQLLTLSDSIYLDLEYFDISYRDVARYFGSGFADALVTLPINQWQQNIKSGYGVHIVKLINRRGGEVESLEQVKNQVRQNWLNKQRKLSLDTFYQTLFEEYQVNISED